MSSDNRQSTPGDPAVAYFGMEIALEPGLPTYYGSREDFQRVMRQAIALNASHFNTQRMMREYVTKAYFHAAAADDSPATRPECCRT